MKRHLRGMSLIEVLVSAFIMMLVVGVVSRSFSVGLRFEDRSLKRRYDTAQRLWLEDRLTQLVQGANLTGSISYFQAPIPATANSAGLSTSQKGGLGAGASSLVLTSSSLQISNQFLTSSERDFKALNARFGPIGGTSEVALSMTPVGDAKGQQGLFLRLQCPADSDNQQGGEELLLGPTVQDIRFQFSDGKQWQDSWDSTGAEKGKLPKLVRIRYQLAEESEAREVLVRLYLSDAQVSTAITSPGPPTGPPPGPSGNNPSAGGTRP